MPNSEYSAHPARILLLEDSVLDAELICEHLRQLHPEPEVRRATKKAEYLAALDDMEFDVILADFSLPDFDGMSALEIAHALVPDTPFIFVSGVLGEEAAIESFRRGATDYVLKQRMIRLAAAVERALAESRERAERKRVEQHRELLVRELSHRVKNTMAMVMSIVRRTAKGSFTVDEYVENLMGRLRAMADAHALLFETNWNEAALEDVIHRTIAAYIRSVERVIIGEAVPVTLDPRAAVAFSMVLNELATNALKYGALRHQDGRVFLNWSVAANEEGVPAVHFRWQEQDGPAITPPKSHGFGTTLITRTIEYELQGSVRLDFDQSGFVCDVIFPLRDPGCDDADGTPLSSGHVRDQEDLTH
ncbi:sensor histidine kinase [Rhizobium helianthi]|uniref:histidine kinase n=1 Tax=Rhizobium helianthi TaxID=1132695 RepID=A0ABW4M8D3_9HYPH